VDLALGFDFGTSGARAVVIDGSGVIQHQGCTGYDLLSAGSWQMALRELMAKIPLSLRPRIASIAVDGTSGTGLLVNNWGVPVTAPLPYYHRCPVNLQLVPYHSPARSSTSSLAKLMYWQATFTEGGEFYFLHQADWLASLLHGQLGISDYHNALKLGYDVVHLQYPPWFPPVKFRLPQVVAPGTPIGTLLPQWCENYHLPKQCVICAGTTDSNAVTIACLAHTPPAGLGITILGSTMVLKVLTPNPIFHGDYGIYSHRWHDPHLNLYVAGGASNTGGAVLKHFFTDQELADVSLSIDPHQASPYDYYPLLQVGERFPICDPHLPARLTPRPPEPHLFLHGLLESMARIEKVGYGRLEECGAVYPTQVITAGGGAVNTTWQTIRGRVLGVPVSRADQADSAYGTALLAQGTDKLGK